MDSVLFVKGLILGFSIAAPVGPIGVLCIRRTLAYGMPAGLLSGLGTATADAIYGAMAAFGVTALANALLEYDLYLRLIGGAFLCYLGYDTYRTEPAEQSAPDRRVGLLGAYASAFGLTLTNPMTILSFAAVFAALGVGNGAGGYAGAALMVTGVFTGSAVWWLILSGVTAMLRSRLDAGRLRLINRLSGMVILGFGIMCFITLGK